LLKNNVKINYRYGTLGVDNGTSKGSGSFTAPDAGIFPPLFAT